MLAILVWIGLTAGRGAWYFAGLTGAAATSVYQQWLMRDRDPGACFQAFLNNNYFGMAVFLGLVLDYAIGA